MRLSSITLARALAFIEIADLDLKGRIFIPALIGEIIQRYQFQIAPKIPSDPQEAAKGLEFRAGKSGDVVIDAFKMFDTLLVAETHSGAADSKRIIEEMLEWSTKKLGLTYQPEMVRRWGYVSNVIFYSDVPLLTLGSVPLANLTHKINGAIAEIWNQSIVYEPALLAVAHDPLARKNSIASFTLQHRNEIPFSENKYFSEAPLPTDLHIKFLEEFEADILKPGNALEFDLSAIGPGTGTR